MAKNNAGVVLILGLAGIGAWLYARSKPAAAAVTAAAVTEPPKIPVAPPTYNHMLPAMPAEQQIAGDIVGGLFGAIKSGVSGWGGMASGVNKQGQSTPLLGNSAFVSRL